MRVQLQQSLQQRKRLLLHLAQVDLNKQRNYLFQGLRLRQFRQFHAQEPRVLQKGLVLFGTQLSQDLLDDKELVYLRVPREQRLSIRKLAQYAPDRPHVRWLPIVQIQQ